MLGRVKIKQSDKLFSQFIRLRDKECKRCFSRVEFNDKGLPVSHHASHFYGRGKQSTRFDEENVDTLCHGCHQEWGSGDLDSYRAFKMKQLGQKRYDLLMLRAHTPQKVDEKLVVIYYRERLKKMI